MASVFHPNKLFTTDFTIKSQISSVNLLRLFQLFNGVIYVWSLVLFIKRLNPGFLLQQVVLLGLAFNTQTILLGQSLSVSPQLEMLNHWRFLIHNICVPLLVIVAVEVAHSANIPWTESSLMHHSIYLIALCVGTVSFIFDYFKLQLAPDKSEGLLLYKPTKAAIPLPAIVTSLCLVIIDLYL